MSQTDMSQSQNQVGWTELQIRMANTGACITCGAIDHLWTACEEECAHCGEVHAKSRCSANPAGYPPVFPVKTQMCITCGSRDHAWTGCEEMCVHCGELHAKSRCIVEPQHYPPVVVDYEKRTRVTEAYMKLIAEEHAAWKAEEAKVKKLTQFLEMYESIHVLGANQIQEAENARQTGGNGASIGSQQTGANATSAREISQMGSQQTGANLLAIKTELNAARVKTEPIEPATKTEPIEPAIKIEHE